MSFLYNRCCYMYKHRSSDPWNARTCSQSLRRITCKAIDIQDATTLEPIPHVNKSVEVKLLDWIPWTQICIEICIHLLAYCSVYSLICGMLLILVGNLFLQICKKMCDVPRTYLIYCTSI
jgi:hypothetical protein